MDTPESLIAAPLAISLFFGAQLVLRGREGGEPVTVETQDMTAAAASPLPLEPIVLMTVLAGLLITGAILVGLEMRAEARDRKT